MGAPAQGVAGPFLALELVGGSVSNLLDVTRISKGNLPKKGRVLAMECEVSPDTAPYLVTSSKGLTWVPHASAAGSINAAVRLKTQPDQFFVDCVEAIHEAGLTWGWGNVLPMTRLGVAKAVEHVVGYDLGEVELLAPPNSPHIALGTGFDIPIRPSSWLPDDLMVVVPKDRGFVGLVYRVTSNDMVGLVHNAARGISLVSCRVGVDSDDVAG